MNTDDSIPYNQDSKPIEKQHAKEAYLKMATALDEKLAKIYQKILPKNNNDTL